MCSIWCADDLDVSIVFLNFFIQQLTPIKIVMFSPVISA